MSGLRVCLVIWWGLLPAAFSSAQDFTLIALPDTQFYSKSYPQIFQSQTQWIADHVADMNIKLVLMEGDIVNGGGETEQWQNADAAMKILDGKAPYMVAIGNHDYDHNDPAGRTASTKNFNAYFGPNRYAGSSWYQGTFAPDSNENYYGIFKFAGKDFLVVVLEVFPRTEVLEWANSVIAANQDKEAVILTHGYMYYDDTRMGRCDNWSKGSFGVDGDNDGNEIWLKLITRQPNIFLVLSGHVTAGDGTGRRADLGKNGNLVNQVLADYQTLPNGGNGFLRILNFRPASNTIEVQTYSPYLDQYKTDDENRFTLIWHAQGGIPGQPGTVNGRVRSAIDCRNIGGAAVTAGTAATTTTDSSGIYKLTLTESNAAAVKVSAAGWISQSTTVDVPPGFSTQAEFFMAPRGKLAGSISGTVRSAVNGRTLGGVSVVAAGTSTRTNSSGAYSIENVAAGTYTVTASLAGWLTNSTTASVVSGEVANANLQLATAGRIAGTVTTSAGSLVSGATVTMSGGVIASVAKATTNSSGAYTSAWIPVGTYSVTVSKSGLATRSGSATVTSGGKFILDFTM